MMVKWLLRPKYIAAIEKYMSFKRGRRRSYTRLEEIEILRLQRLESLMPKQPSLYHLWQPAIRHFSVSSPISGCPKPEIAPHSSLIILKEYAQEYDFDRTRSTASFWQNMIKSIILEEYDQEHHFDRIWSRASFWQNMIKSIILTEYDEEHHLDRIWRWLSFLSLFRWSPWQLVVSIPMFENTFRLDQVLLVRVGESHDAPVVVVLTKGGIMRYWWWWWL